MTGGTRGPGPSGLTVCRGTGRLPPHAGTAGRGKHGWFSTGDWRIWWPQCRKYTRTHRDPRCKGKGGWGMGVNRLKRLDSGERAGDGVQQMRCDETATLNRQLPASLGPQVTTSEFNEKGGRDNTTLAMRA